MGGYAHPDHLLRDLTAEQILEWELYFKKEPFGHELGFYQAGIISSVIANVNRGKGARAFSPEDFIPEMYLAKVKKKQSMKEMKDLLRSMSSKRKKKNG